eukprot:TRINITY_DN91_c0_g1_i6.p1 TRINITY_DN91_c0_g1~~TRINITY_DN91_c0_g1_i6.p1  ORF type:complete len:477 (-),score=136.54 TRINITY_DN91_c0_g1_i6:132-1562(-)
MASKRVARTLLVVVAVAAALLHLPVSVDAANPGLNIYFTSSAITKAAEHILPAVVAEIKDITIPGNKGKHFDYDEIKFSDVAIQDFQVSFQAPNHVLVNIVGLTIQVAHTHFSVFDKVAFVKVSCSGNFWGEAVNTQIHLNASVVDVNGKPQLPDIINSETYGQLKVDHHFSNDICKIADKIVDLVADVNKVVENIIRNEVPKIIAGKGKDAMNKALMDLSMEAKVGNFAELRYDLTSNPEVFGSSLALHLMGEFVAVKNPVPPPFQPAPLPTPKLGRDFEMQISDYTFNTASQVFTQAGLLDIRNHPIPQNTSVFQKILPAIFNRCPDCPMTVDYGIATPPVATFDANDAAIRIDSSALNLTVVTKNASNPHWQLFDLGVSATIDIGLSIQNELLKINLGLPKFQMKMINSFIGPFNITLISDVIDAVLKDVILPDFDKKFPGIPLPSGGNIVLDNPQLIQAPHCAIIATDFHYK